VTLPAYAVEPRPGYDDFAVVVRTPAGRDLVALLQPRMEGSRLVVGVEIRSSDRPDDRAALAMVPGWLHGWTSSSGVTEVEVHTRDPHLRHALRGAGYDGPLRRPLSHPALQPTAAPFPRLDAAGASLADAAQWPDARSGPAPPGRSTGGRANALGAFVQALVPWADIRAARGGGVARLLAGLAVGQLQLLELEIRAGGTRHPLRLRVPDRPDLLPEQVALAADVAATVLRRFPWLRVLALSFDQGVAGLRVGKLGGYAMPQARSDIHVNGAYVLDEVVLPPRSHPHQSGFHPPTGRTWIEDVVAHELWHAVEHDFEVRRFRESMAFRQELGRFFDLETIEHVFDPGNEAARRRLAFEVSGYAADSRREATAELFTEWWLSARPRPAAAAFGALVERYLPPAA
jgi:hypothetical protein